MHVNNSEQLDQFRPIAWGTFKLLAHIAFVVAFVWLLVFLTNTKQEFGYFPTTPRRWVVSGILFAYLAFSNWGKKWSWLVSYWHRNVVKYCVFFKLGKDGSLEWYVESARAARFYRHSAILGFGYLDDSDYLVFCLGSRAEYRYKCSRWRASLHYYYAAPACIEVRLSDGESSLVLPVRKILDHFADPRGSIENTFCDLMFDKNAYVDLLRKELKGTVERGREESAALRTKFWFVFNLVTTAIERIERTKRFQHSKEGEAIRLWLEEEALSCLTEKEALHYGLHQEYQEYMARKGVGSDKKAISKA